MMRGREIERKINDINLPGDTERSAAERVSALVLSREILYSLNGLS